MTQHRDHPYADDDCTCTAELDHKHTRYDGMTWCPECDEILYTFP